MKFFEREYSINFVDDKNVFVGYELDQCCCEDAGFAFCHSEEKFESFDGEGLLYKAEQISINLEPYSFDEGFFKESEELMDGGAKALFRLVAKDKSELFLILYNNHNGYYAHGFEVKDKDGNLVKDGWL